MAIDITELIDKLPPLKIPGLHSTDSIGIDLGSYSIKIVQLKTLPGKIPKYALVRWSIIPLTNSGSDEKGELSPEEKKARAIRLLRTYRGSGKGIPKNAVTSVSGNTVIVRYVKFPKLTQKELSKTIKAEAEPYVPFNIEEVYLAFHPLRDVTEEGKNKMETVVVAAKKDFVTQRIEVLEEAGFKPSVIDVDAFTLESCYEILKEPGSPPETVLVANIGYSKTNFVIIENGVSIVVKDSPIAGSSLTKGVSKNLGVDARTAEKLKIVHGILYSEEEKQAAVNENNKEALAVSDAASAASKDIASETKKIIQYHITQGKDKKIDRVLVTGGFANIKNFVPYFSNELNLPVEKLNPFAKITGSQGIPEDAQSSLAVACGLAMRKPGDTPT
jgi:type IV pilus assembly protein PilM